MTHELKQRELIIDLTTGEYQINPIIHRIHGIHIIGPVDYGWARFSEAVQESGRKDPLIFTWGNGPLAGSRIPGTRRLVFCGYSPSWEGFYISSLGGAAYIMHRLGVDFVCLKGAAEQDSVLVLNHRDGEISVRIEPLRPDALWSGYANPQGERLIGFYALQQAVFDRYAGEYVEDWVRVFATGPAARYTNQGIIGSNPIKKRAITSIDDWAGRGGLGSQLLQRHHIAACIFGGDWEDPDLKDSKEIDGYFQLYYGQPMIKVDLGATEKYRYAPGFQTGGTFGVNMQTINDNLLSFNYASIYASDQERLDQHSQFILGHYLKQFNEETIQPKNFAHCGEPCSVACKKYDRQYKKDYEPYEALGPQCGIFDHRASELLNHYIDAMGIDAIQMGGMIAWVMELVRDGLIDPKEFGLAPLPPCAPLPAFGTGQEVRNTSSFRFASKAVHFEVVEDSRRNAEYAMKVAAMILFEPAGEIFRKGMRSAAKLLPSSKGKRAIDRAVFTAHGEAGCMAPNQYWVPGMLAPMPMMGKYFVYYGNEYVAPKELGCKCVERMVFELFNENSGTCRFHRKWAEAIIDEIISSHYHFPVDYKAHQFEIARHIFESEGQTAAFWESERTVDLVWQFLEKWERFGLKDESLHDWVRRFRQDKWKAAREYWEELFSGIRAAFAAGAEAVPDNVQPHASASSSQGSQVKG